MDDYALKSWTDISDEVKNLLQLNDIALNEIMDVGLIFVTLECRIKLSGSPWKPEYWVNDVKCRFDELIRQNGITSKTGIKERG